MTNELKNLPPELLAQLSKGFGGNYAVKKNKPKVLSKQETVNKIIQHLRKAILLAKTLEDSRIMHITITEQEYKDLTDVKRKHEALRDKINNRIGQLREGRKDSRLSESEKLTMTIFIDMLQELLA